MKHEEVFSVLSNCNFLVISLSYIYQLHGRYTTLRSPILLLNWNISGQNPIMVFINSLIELSYQIKSKGT